MIQLYAVYKTQFQRQVDFKGKRKKYYMQVVSKRNGGHTDKIHSTSKRMQGKRTFDIDTSFNRANVCNN